MASIFLDTLTTLKLYLLLSHELYLFFKHFNIRQLNNLFVVDFIIQNKSNKKFYIQTIKSSDVDDVLLCRNYLKSIAKNNLLLWHLVVYTKKVIDQNLNIWKRCWLFVDLLDNNFTLD